MNLNQLSWDDLRIFLSVARTGNLSKAGRQLAIDHATAGRRISALEHALGTPVFERDRSGYRLNKQGRDMLVHVEAVEANVLTLSEAIEGGAAGLVGTVRIATMEGIASLYLSEQLVTLTRRSPGLKVELVTSARDVRISHREADLFLGFFQPSGSNLNVIKVGRFGLRLYAHPAYLARHGTPVTPTGLASHSFIGYIDDLIQLEAVRWLDEVITDPHIEIHSSSMLAQMFAAVAEGGIVMLPVFARPERFGLVEVLAGQVNVFRDIWLSSHHYLQHVPRIRAVAAFLAETIVRDYPPSVS
jgi:DNA-binding transcriptional LysR family regulator